MSPLPSVPRLWPGETVVCLATGPSLTQADCDFIRGKARVIAVNDAHRLAPWADVLYSSDRYWWPHYKGVPSFTGPKYGIGSNKGKANGFHGLPDIQVLKNTGLQGIERDPSGLRSGKNSGYAAINLAIHFGASRVLLLGYNMAWRGGKAHFFGNHPPRLSQAEWKFQTFKRLYATMVEPLGELGVTVINCTEQSSLNCFPHGNIRELLAREVAA